MAGGVGSRLWPLSTKELPKQFVDVLGLGRSLLQITVERFLPVCPMENVWVVTSRAYSSIVREQLPDIPSEQILLEPVGRNTAPCIAYACSKIEQRYPGCKVVVTPADAFVLNTERFAHLIRKSLDFLDASADPRIVTVGIDPTRPETGYGYIRSCAASRGIVHKVEEFKEKPDLKTAESYLKDGRYFWNAGIFIFAASTILSELREHAPQIMEQIDRIAPQFYTAQESEALDKYFPLCEKISIDFAVMEKSRHIYVIAHDLGWSDLGTWGSVRQYRRLDASGNTITSGQLSLHDCRDCMCAVEDGLQIIAVGLENYIIAYKNGKLLVCPLSREQDIKDFV